LTYTCIYILFGNEKGKHSIILHGISESLQDSVGHPLSGFHYQSLLKNKIDLNLQSDR